MTDLAVERQADISASDFRTLNRCLDDAIAAAVSAYSHQERRASANQSSELLRLVTSAMTAFEMLQRGSVGIAGATGALVHRNLAELRDRLGLDCSVDPLPPVEPFTTDTTSFAGPSSVPSESGIRTSVVPRT